MPEHDSDRDPENLSFEPVAWDREDSDSSVLRVLDDHHLRLLRRLAAGDSLFLLIDPAGAATYDFGPDDPVSSAIVRTLLDLQAIEFHGAPGALVAMRARLTGLGRAILERLP